MKSLGPVVARWITKNLPDPADPTQPFRLVPWQVELVNRWYAIDDAGRFVYRRGQARAPKGSGKSPLEAAIAIAELRGSVLFAGWDAKGNPWGRPWDVPTVQVLATAEGQAKSNVYTMIERFLTLNDGAAAEALNLDVGKMRVYVKGVPGAELRPVTSAADAREGQRLTFAAIDESQLLVPSSGGVELARTLMRNSAKVGGRTLEFANAYLAGAGSVAERTEAAAKAGEKGILLYAISPSRVPEPTESDEDLLALLDEVYAGCTWIDTRRLLEEIRDPGVPWTDSVFYFNVPGAEVGMLVDVDRWGELEADPDHRDGRRPIALGFVGQSGYAALVAATEYGHLDVIESFRDPDRTAVKNTVKMLCADFDVRGFYADPRGWSGEVEQWQEQLGDRCLAFPTSSPRRMAPAIDRFRAAVATGELSHDGDPELFAHVGAARVRETRIGYNLESASEGRPITLASAAVLSFEARAHAQWAPLEYCVM